MFAWMRFKMLLYMDLLCQCILVSESPHISMLWLYMYDVISLILSEDPVSIPFVFMNNIRVCKGGVDVM